jgi:hypothetical protein
MPSSIRVHPVTSGCMRPREATAEGACEAPVLTVKSPPELEPLPRGQMRPARAPVTLTARTAVALTGIRRSR